MTGLLADQPAADSSSWALQVFDYAFSAKEELEHCTIETHINERGHLTIHVGRERVHRRAHG